MSYSSALDQLNAMAPELHTQPGHPRRKFSLEEIGILLEALGNPHHRFRSILIAGTNGKGSTAATLASILQAAGLRTGLYTSPHLTRPNERIRINSDEISNDAFASAYFRVHLCAQKLIEEGRLAQAPSFFEHLTAMAFLHFADQQIDFAVLEVGLGGRLDATNIVDPLISVITDVSLDHIEWLGPTISAIAREKAGILRPNGTLVTLPQHPEANQAIGEIATALNVRAISAVPYMPATADDADQDTYRIHALGRSIEIASPLHGAHQHRNIALAIAAAIELGSRRGLPIAPEAIATGIRNTRWPGRLEIIETGASSAHEIEWILDVAHNPAGAWALRASLRRNEGKRGCRTQTRGPQEQASVRGVECLIFSCLRDKPVAELAQILFPLFDRVIFAPIPSPRATPMPDLLAAASATGTPATAAASIAEALTLAEQFVFSDSTINPAITTNLGAPSVRGSIAHGWESTIPNTANPAITTNLGAPGLDSETWENTDLNPTTNLGAPSMRPPLSHGWESTNPTPRIVISGSVYLVGEARPLLLARAEKSLSADPKEASA